MKKNTAVDLQDHLMARIEALSDEGLKGEKLDSEIRRTEATVKVAGAMIDNARVVLDAQRLLAEYGGKPALDRKSFPMLIGNKGDNNGDGA